MLSTTVADVSSPGSSSSDLVPTTGGNQPLHVSPFLTSVSGVKHSKHELSHCKGPRKKDGERRQAAA